MAITRNERGALKLLYWATHGQRWAAQWAIQNENSDPCLDSWRWSSGTASYAIATAASGPLSTLTALRTLRLDRNYFIGPVPASIAELTMLEFLEIQENNFDPVNAYGGVLPDAVQQLTDPEGQHCHIIF
ncbi:hypothetical protein ON010_g16489 [Phytophthora cinnamomi]|nr:hypothetical protein ON010_g16489 [Phytophthora cinnamomi]